MPNDKYIPGALRVVVDSKGVQRLADPDGTPIPAIISTTIHQNTEQARFGVCLCVVDLYVDTGSPLCVTGGTKADMGRKEIQLPDGSWYKPIMMAFGCPGKDESPYVTIHVNAYLDPTT